MLADKIERLNQSATPGEWVTAPDHISDQNYETCIELAGKAGQIGPFIADFHHNWQEDRISWKAAQSNAALCVTLRNAVPQIIAALNAQAEVEALRARVVELETAAIGLRDDLLDRAKWCGDTKVVVAGNGVWHRFCKALEAKP